MLVDTKDASMVVLSVVMWAEQMAAWLAVPKVACWVVMMGACSATVQEMRKSERDL